MGYVSKHKQRDLELPVYRKELMENALSDLTNDSDVIAIYLSGSLAKENFDNYSDIDLHIIVKDEKKKEFIQAKRNRPRNWGEVLYYEDSSAGAPYIVVHYSNFVKVDTWYHELNEIRPSIWLKDLKVIYDPESKLAEIFAKSSSLEYKKTTKEVELWRGKVFAYMHETYRSVMRNETYYALSNLNSFRLMMAYGWYMEMGRRVDTAWGVWSKFEGERSYLKDWQLCLLHTWDCTRNHNEIMKTMASMIPEFKRLNKALCDAVGLDEDSEWCNKIIENVL